MAMAAFAVAGSGSAWSLGLGKLTVQSSLGETLKAEIDVSSLTAEEAGTLKVRIAPPDSYRATGVEYNAVLTGTQVQLERRSDGRPVLRINSDRAVQEPFVDVILELTWSSGRLVREYTLLFDPPNLARPSPPPAVTTAPSFATAPAETRAVSRGGAGRAGARATSCARACAEP
ncbi:type IV pilus assembly protein FimV [Paucibacter sp. XJ19-41]|uniref:type IV pilus assembly protein FimV n=1 Tax=Paucibacter sp. XJ19-41 TaxID=2927824 RepID=UPI003FA7D7C8